MLKRISVILNRVSTALFLGANVIIAPAEVWNWMFQFKSNLILHLTCRNNRQVYIRQIQSCEQICPDIFDIRRDSNRKPRKTVCVHAEESRDVRAQASVVPPTIWKRNQQSTVKADAEELTGRRFHQLPNERNVTVFVFDLVLPDERVVQNNWRLSNHSLTWCRFLHLAGCFCAVPGGIYPSRWHKSCKYQPPSWVSNQFSIFVSPSGTIKNHFLMGKFCR